MRRSSGVEDIKPSLSRYGVFVIIVVVGNTGAVQAYHSPEYEYCKNLGAFKTTVEEPHSPAPDLRKERPLLELRTDRWVGMIRLKQQ